MISEAMVNLSRWQFAATSMYHFLFVPLTLGLSFLLAIMESTYVMTGKEIYKDMTQFWGKLFGINFALGVTTGLTMEFQFGMNCFCPGHQRLLHVERPGCGFCSAFIYDSRRVRIGGNTFGHRIGR